jgi:hypothetical protein
MINFVAINIGAIFSSCLMP